MTVIAKNYFAEDAIGDREDIARSIELLQIELENFVNEHADEDLQEAPAEVQNEVGFLLYTLGKDFYIMEDYATAAEYFETGLAFDLDVAEEYVLEMVVGYGLSLYNSNQGKNGIVLQAIYDEFGEHADFVFMMGLVFMEQKQYEQAVIEFAKATTLPAEKLEGANGSLAYQYAGKCREKQGRMEEANEFYQKAR